MNRMARWARQFGVARAVCLVLLFALVPLRLADPRPLAELRLRTFDLFQVLRPREQKARPVVIVDIDEDSLKEIGQWPWPRTTLADLVTRITQAGAVTVGFDVIFAEPDRMSPAVAEHSFRGIDAETRAKLDSLPSNDAIFADAIKQSRVVVGQAGSATPAPKGLLRRRSPGHRGEKRVEVAHDGAVDQLDPDPVASLVKREHGGVLTVQRPARLDRETGMLQGGRRRPEVVDEVAEVVGRVPRRRRPDCPRDVLHQLEVGRLHRVHEPEVHRRFALG